VSLYRNARRTQGGVANGSGRRAKKKNTGDFPEKKIPGPLKKFGTK
jgi:hypothetical protein